MMKAASRQAREIVSRESTSASSLPKGQQQSTALKTPLYAWPLLLVSVLSVSSAGPLFEFMSDVPALTLPAWRLQLTALLLLVPGIWQYSRFSTEEMRKLVRDAPLIGLSGISLAVHFGTWVWGLQHTSLPHSLLIMSSTPLVIAIGSLLLGQPLSIGEIGGTAFGMCGALVLTIGGRSDTGATLVGDLVCGASVFGVIAYISLGRRLRTWIPLFAYMFTISGCAALLLSITAVFVEGARLWQLGTEGVFGWLSLSYLGPVTAIAAGPGVIGHTGFNALLRWMHPLQITLPQTINPILGSLEGWVIGVAALPSGLPTYLGGAMLLTSTVVVLLAAHRRDLQQRKIAEVEMPIVIFSKSPKAGDSFWEDGDGESEALTSSSHAGAAAPSHVEAEHHVASSSTPSLELSTEQRKQQDGSASGLLGRLQQWVRSRRQTGIEQAGDLEEGQAEQENEALLPRHMHVLEHERASSRHASQPL